MPVNKSCLQWLVCILYERFGHSFVLNEIEGGLNIQLQGTDGQICFDKLVKSFFEVSSDIPFTTWDPESEGWQSGLESPLPAPGVAHMPSPLVEGQNNQYIIHYDILGLTYWMLLRLEEINRTDLDDHGRFPATSSHAFKYGYLERPIVDEWLHVLGQVIQATWPGIKLKQHSFRIKVSHDVDRPFQYLFKTSKTIARQIAGDILKRKNLKMGLQRFVTWRSVKRGLLQDDPFNTFDFIMDNSEQHGLQSSFYFICGRTDPQIDADYDIEHSAMRALLRRIHERGHEIGLHPSYNTYRSSEAIVSEAVRLRQVCESEGIKQTVWGGRMHYLRWQQPTTLQGWEAAEMNYDSTLSYADHAGFRCGTCFEFPGYDPICERMLNLRIRPLILTDWLCKDIEYRDLIQTVNRMGGCLTILWHNCTLVGTRAKEEYRALLNSVSTAQTRYA